MSVWKRVSVGAHDPAGKTESMVGFKNIYLLIFIQWFIVTVFEKWQWQSGHSAENIQLGIWHQQHWQIWKLFLTMHHYRGYEVRMEAILWPLLDIWMATLKRQRQNNVYKRGFFYQFYSLIPLTALCRSLTQSVCRSPTLTLLGAIPLGCFSR